MSLHLPLAGYRVLDMSRVLAGPFCSMLLGDLGADVIKVEQVGKGDMTRMWGPPFLGNESTYFYSVNRNKRSIAIDFKHPDGSRIIRRLAGESDIFIENFMVGSLARYGLDYDTLSKLNKDLIYCSITGYGQSGPYSKKPGFDVVVAAEGGLMHITGPEDGPPCKVGVAVTDLTTGLHAKANILAALVTPSPRVKKPTGSRGCHIDVNLLSAQVSMLSHVAAAYLLNHQEYKRLGTAHANIVPYQAYPTADAKWFVIGAGSNEQFKTLCELIGRREYLSDSRFQSNALRVKHRNILNGCLKDVFRSKVLGDWCQIFSGSNLPHGPVNSLEELFNNPQVKFHWDRLIQTWQLPEGPLSVPAYPVHSSKFSPSRERPPPRLGEHSREILRDVLELPDFEIDQLVDQSVIQEL